MIACLNDAGHRKPGVKDFRFAAFRVIKVKCFEIAVGFEAFAVFCDMEDSFLVVVKELGIAVLLAE